MSPSSVELLGWSSLLSESGLNWVPPVRFLFAFASPSQVSPERITYISCKFLGCLFPDYMINVNYNLKLYYRQVITNF